MPQGPMNADIEAILRARRYAAIEQSVQVSLPALPLEKKGAPLRASPTFLVRSIIQPARVPSVQVAPPPEVNDQEVAAFLETFLPMLVRAAQDSVMPPFVVGNGMQLSLAVSQAVTAGLPQVRGEEARALIAVITRLLWRKYATPLLPDYAGPAAGLLESQIIAGTEIVYHLFVKRHSSPGAH